MSDIYDQIQIQRWSPTIWALALTALAVFVHHVVARTSFVEKAPKFWRRHDWPFLGALRFYSHRHDMYRQAQQSTKTGNFSFYVGKKQVVGLSGVAGRSTFFDSRELDFSEGFAELYAGQPAMDKSESGKFDQWFSKSLITMMKKENFVRNLDKMAGDARVMCESLAAAPSSTASPGWSVIDPFDSIYPTVYQLSMRIIGAQEIAEDPILLKRSLSIFQQFESRTSTAKVIFPWLPTPYHLLRLYHGAVLYNLFQKIVNKRKKATERIDDALQLLLDGGATMQDIISFEIAALFAGQVNTGVQASYLPLYWAANPEWKAKVREEVDCAIAKYRCSPDQSPADVLDTLEIEQWESEFKVIDLSLREALRLGMPGTGFRKNTTDKDIPIGNTGEVIAKGTFAAYLLDEVHLDPEIYTNPLTFDPSRYSEDRAEHKRRPHAFLGWGSGRHPCLGMKFAKLEVTMISAYFVAMFDFELSDKNGNVLREPLPPIDRNLNQIRRPAKATYIRYKVR